MAGDQLLVLTEKGELIRVAASPEKFKESARAQILGNGVRTYPALADGFFTRAATTTYSGKTSELWICAATK